MDRCGIFVLSSRFEGFPNVLLEAMATGAPCIAFDCPSGPSEIIESGTNALLVPAGEVAGLADSLKALVQSPETRARLGANARKITERYSATRITDDWESLLVRVCKPRAAGIIR
jgi:glycosyltransferase involved in cell wall biosynthesis